MKNISYKRVITNASAAADEITNRAAKKNRLYALSFILLAIVVTGYVMYEMSLTAYDGFMVSRNVTIRTPNDIVVVNYRVKPGDEVKEGDTLYSYMNVEWINKATDPYYEAQSGNRAIDAAIRRDRLRSEYSKQKQTIDSLGGVIKKANNDVYLGVATKEYAQQLEWELFTAQKELENTSRLIAIEQREVELESALKGRMDRHTKQIGAYSYTERMNNREVFGLSYNYRVAYVDMVIVDLRARHGVLIMKGEPIVTYMPHHNPEMLDMHVKMFLNPDQFSKVKDSMIFNAYAGDDYIGKVRTTYRSTFINDHDMTTQDHYERDYKQQDILVRAEFLDKGCVYAKYQVDKYPLTLTRYKWEWVNNIMEKENQRRRNSLSDEARVHVTVNNEN